MAVVRKSRSSEKKSGARRESTPPEWSAIAVFALLVTAAPLAFGAVDRVVQAALLVLFALGLAIKPPSVVRLSRRANALILGFVSLVLLAQFAPAPLFGSTRWRTDLTQNFGLQFPWTHHPEPGRALEGLLAGGLAVIWLLWVRTLAERRENRQWLAWALAGAAAMVALVSFATKSGNHTAIYGLRYTEGWRGFGPFPNRNHTACFLAMGVILSCGCTTFALLRRKYLSSSVGFIFAAVSLAGLLATESRGGVVALAAGLAVYGGLCLAKFRNRKAAAAVAAVALILGAAALAGGSQLFARFSSADGAVSNNTRVAIWLDTLKMWGDAPLFGHGIGAFGSVFPVYESIQLDNQMVLHPESSWLQWLSELGALPVLLAVLLVGGFLFLHVPHALKARRSFFLYAAGFAAFGALMIHSAIDVPAHRWATVAFGLAALGIAAPRARGASARESEWNVHSSHFSGFPRRAVLVPLAVAALWLLPLFAGAPASATLTLQRVLAAADEGRSVPAETLQSELKAFPLSPLLHHAAGEQKLRAGAPQADWFQHFRTAAHLNPGSWRMPSYQAQLCGPNFPEQAIYFWRIAVERGGVRMEEIFDNALRQTQGFPQAEVVWGAYAADHPALALEYAARLPFEEAQPVFRVWWQARALNRDLSLSPREAHVFYSLAPRHSSPQEFMRYLEARPARVSEDFLECARLLHAWNEDQRAWQLLSTKLRNPEFPKARAGVARSDLERRLRVNPSDAAGAQALAATCMAEADPAGAREVILAFAKRPNAPAFFTRKAAYYLYGDGKLAEAVETISREGT